MLTRRKLIKLAISRSNSFHTPRSHDDAAKAELSSEDHVYVITRRYFWCSRRASSWMQNCRVLKRRGSWRALANWIANIDALTRAIVALEKGCMEAVSIRTTASSASSAIRELARSSNRVLNEDLSRSLSHSSSGEPPGPRTSQW